VRLETVTVIPVPTEEVAKVPIAPAVFSVTASPGTTPTSAAPVVFKVADVVPSYVLLLAVIPVTVSGFAVMVCDKTLEVLLAKLLSPPYTAVMECGEPETERVLVENVATPGVAPFRVPVPSVVTPS
jgi:hypothetical protein